MIGACDIFVVSPINEAAEEKAAPFMDESKRNDSFDKPEYDSLFRAKMKEVVRKSGIAEAGELTNGLGNDIECTAPVSG